ncbi:MAG: hypothetical protein DWQ36_15620 [Acidobacteria bacterium]|nr:MAG: hypothetical protein DWQ30_01555 [Acidobacteriota bacterium]REK05932.1 MAG: hypothetical protein DWQ36_15620 [Acidobacteriota bacterium]
MSLSGAAQPEAASSGQLLYGGDQHLRAGRVEAALEAYDAALAQRPELLPQLWQRGIALYYAGRWDECTAQFEAHRTVNPDDVENAAWHLLCAARRDGLAAARRTMLPVGPDPRPALAEVYALYAGRGSAEEVLAAAEVADRGGSSARFYAHLYIGLLREIEGAEDEAETHLAKAVEQEFPHFMGDVARLHLDRLRGTAARD